MKTVKNMNDVMKIIEEFKRPCSCGITHETTIKDICIGSGLVNYVGEILKRNGFPKGLLLVADQNTLKASEGILESLSEFEVESKIYTDLRVADMEQVEEIEALIKGKDIAVLSVGTGSINDPCRLAAARQDKMLCIFGTAPSMDGFASYSSPIVADGFKSSYAAKSPEVIIGDTKILAKAPVALKSAGFGDMISKYIALVDWKISCILTDEIYCERVAELTRDAVDKLMRMADRVTVEDEETAGEIFQALLMTGIGMSFMKNSRPASGSEHIIAHLVECVELRENIIPNYHGEDVGVCTLLTLKEYKALAERANVETRREKVNWQEVYDFYGEMAPEIRKVNEPTTIADDVDPEVLQAKWSEIREIILSVPSYEECYTAMSKAGCSLTIGDIGKSQELMDNCVKYSPYMRRRLTLARLRDMIEWRS